MLPPEFNEQEHLQDTVRKWINREIRNYFADVGGDDWDPDIVSPRASLRVACTHRDTDSLIMTQLRWQLFERIRRQTFDMPYFGIPIVGFNEARKFKPQIMLYFQEDLQDVEVGYSPVTGEVSFRLMNYESDTITPAIAQQLATRVQSNLGQGGGFVWRKGRTMCSYTDRPRGYQLQLLCRNDDAARLLVTQVLDIQNHTPDWSRLNVSENQEESSRYPTIPPTGRVYGETRRLNRARPMADVRFQFAILNVHGLQNPIPLYDRSGVYPGALAS